LALSALALVVFGAYDSYPISLGAFAVVSRPGLEIKTRLLRYRYSAHGTGVRSRVQFLVLVSLLVIVTHLLKSYANFSQSTLVYRVPHVTRVDLLLYEYFSSLPTVRGAGYFNSRLKTSEMNGAYAAHCLRYFWPKFSRLSVGVKLSSVLRINV